MDTDKHGFNPEEIILRNGKNITLKYKEITHEILNSAFEVSNVLGIGFLEKVYENALIYELEKKGFLIENQKAFKIQYKEIVVGTYYADIVVDSKIVLEIKNVDKIAGVHDAQVLNYLKASGLEVGLILNFKNTRLDFKRLVL